MSLNPENTTIGFIGTGVMGKSMAGHLLKAGYNVLVHNRTKLKAQELLDAGALWRDDIGELASESRIVITMVGYPQDVEEVYLGEDGLVKHAQPGTYLIDMTTSSPKLAQKIYSEAKTRQIYALDAPVSGGDIGAREAKLAIMVGGDEDAFEAVKPIFERLGSNILWQGPAGSGQYTKMCNQIAIAGTMVGVSEAMAYATKSGLDPVRVLQSIETGAAESWSLRNLAPRMIKGNFAPGFYVKHFIKDMTIALNSAAEMNLDLPGLERVKALYESLAASGEENSGTHALYKLYQK